LEGYRKRSSVLKSPWPVGRPLGVGAGRLLPLPSTLGGIVGNDGTLLYSSDSSDAGHGDDVALVNNPISEGEAA
jgi:hypothetical protein